MKKGVTLVELIAVMAVLGLLFSASYLVMNVYTNKQNARDVKRLSDISTIDEAVNEYLLTNSDYPDLENTLRISTVIPEGSISLDNASGSWIAENLSPFLSRMPIDPLNDSEHFYSYINNGNSYELNVFLESMEDKMTEDGGNDPQMYEIGNNLNLISP